MKDKEKAIKLYDFLEEFSKLKYKPVLNIKDQVWSLYIKNIPTYEDYVKVSYPEDGEDDDNLENNQSVIALLSVKKPDFFDGPIPPNKIQSYLENGWDNYRNNVEVKTEKIYDEAKDDLVETNPIDEDDKLKIIFDDWMEKRNEWVDIQKKIEKVRELYTTLYKLYVDLDRNSETFEIMVGNGFIKAKGNKKINHPLLLKSVSFSFDPEENIINIIDNDSDSEIFTDPLQNLDVNLKSIQNDLQDNTHHPLDQEKTPNYLKVIAHKLSSTCKFTMDENHSDFGYQDDYIIYLKPVFFVRKRIDGAPKLINKIIDHIQNTGYVPEFIREIVSGGQIEIPEDITQPSIEQELAAVGGEDPEILLSKPANKEQLEIAKRIQNYNAVLVQGPPGTGKTHTIANLLGHFLSQGKSVLVTSHTKKALTVLKEKVDPNLQNLCVSVLDDSRKDMEKSIEGIMLYLSGHSSFNLKSDIAKIKNERNDIIKRLGATRRKLYEIKFKECNSIVLNGESISPSDAAKFVRAHQDDLSYIPGPVKLNVPLPASLEELAALYASNGEITTNNEKELSYNLPDPDDILKPEQVLNDWQMIHQLEAKISDITKLYHWNVYLDEANDIHFDGDNHFIISHYSKEHGKQAIEYLKDLPQSQENWVKMAIIDGKRGSGFLSRWRMLTETLEETEALSQSLLGSVKSL